MKRLHPSGLHRLPGDVRQPRYPRGALRAGIVHLGVGAFVRAHLAAATEAAIHADGDLRWGIAGVSLKRPDTRDALAPQQGLYTLSLRDAASDGLQVMGALTQVLVAPEDPAAVLARIAHDDTRIVSLTVTEKGYDAQTIGLLVRGLEARMKHGRGPITLLSCDNLPHNGERLREQVLAFAAEAGAALRAWIASGCTFPNSMVDRIVPATTDADRERIAPRLGLHDAWPVVAEPFFDWVVEDRFAAGRPAWDAGGARLVDSAEPYERIKLRMVNGSHSALAYLGLLDGLDTVDQAMATPLRTFIDRLMRDEIAPTLPALPGFDIDAQRERLLKRFANPALRHSLRQIASDGSQKLPQRLLDTIRDRLRAGASIEHLARAVAGWMAFVRAAGPVNDPMFTTFEAVFGDLAAEPRFLRAVETAL